MSSKPTQKDRGLKAIKHTKAIVTFYSDGDTPDMDNQIEVKDCAVSSLDVENMSVTIVGSSITLGFLCLKDKP